MGRFTDLPAPGAVRLGIILSFQDRPSDERRWSRVYREELELAAAAERLGVDDVWVTEHHGEPDGYCPSPLVAMGAVAAATTQVRLCQGVALAPLQGHPLRLAEDLAVVDNLSGGRVEVGLGQGYRPEEFAAFGLDFGARTAALSEALDILDLAWSGERFDYDGRCYRVSQGQLCPPPVRPGRPPLWLGAAAPRSRARAVRRRAGLIIAPLTDFAHTARQFAAFDAEADRQGVGPLPHALVRQVVVGADDADAHARARPHLDYLYRVQYAPERTGMTYVDPDSGERRALTRDDPYYLSERFIDERFVIGSPETCAAKLADYIDTMRLDRVIFHPRFPGQSLAEAIEATERVTRDVWPELRRRLGAAST